MSGKYCDHNSSSSEQVFLLGTMLFKVLSFLEDMICIDTLTFISSIFSANLKFSHWFAGRKLSSALELGYKII